MQTRNPTLALLAAAGLVAAIGTAACEKRADNGTGTSNTGSRYGSGTGTTGTTTTTPGTTGTTPVGTTGTTGATGTTTTTTPDADNTARNTRDRDAARPTPPDQGENETDRKITAEIRRAIMATDGMSINAQNVKIITRNGIVTLRGPVNSTAERDAIAAKAKAAAGVTSVVNELEVKVDN